MLPLGELRVQAVVENLRTISYFLNGIAQRLKLTEKTLFDIELAVEEAATNIVRHAYPDDRPGDMVLKADLHDELLRLTLTDWGVPLDPDDVKPFDITAPVETRIQGGMGLHFINMLMDSVTRKTTPEVGGPNLLILSKRIERLGPGVEMPSTLRELNAMLSVSQFMGTTMELDNLLRLIVDELVDTLDAERGTLFLVDEAAGELYSRVVSEQTGDLKEIRVRIGEGIAGYVAETGHVLNIKDAYESDQFKSSFDEASGFRSRSILTAPMRNPHQKIIGVVQVLNKQGGEPFGPRDERLLGAIAAQAAISIENARLYQQEIRQQLLNQELETARAIQRSFLPEQLPEARGWDIGTYWLPMRDVGGDFYDFVHLADGRLAIVIADVSGKGVPAAMFMAFGETVLRFAMSLDSSPGETLNRANQFIIANQHSKMFATVFIGYLDMATGEFTYASAGHNPPLLYRTRTGGIDYLEAPGVALGVFKQALFGENRVRLEAGDVLVLYTDGVTEAINSEEDEFEETRLENVVRANVGASAQALAEKIIHEVEVFCGEMGVYDDETLVVLKRQ